MLGIPRLLSIPAVKLGGFYQRRRPVFNGGMGMGVFVANEQVCPAFRLVELVVPPVPDFDHGACSLCGGKMTGENFRTKLRNPYHILAPFLGMSGLRQRA